MSNGTQMATPWGQLDPYMQQSYYAGHGYDTSGGANYSFGQGGVAPPLMQGYSPYSAPGVDPTAGQPAGGGGGGAVTVDPTTGQPVTTDPNAQTSTTSSDAAGGGGGNWLDLIGTAYSAYQDYQSVPTVDPAIQAQNLSPLTESYENLQKMAEEYRDPQSSTSQKQRDEIRTRDMEGFADMMDRQRTLATGEYTSDVTKPINTRVMSDAIGTALKNYNLAHSDRLKTAADIEMKSANIANVLAQARQQNYYTHQQQKAAQAGKKSKIAGDLVEYGFDWLKSKF